MASYNATALGNAELQGKTAAQVAAMTYAEIAALAEVNIEPSGGSPVDFMYMSVRHAAVRALVATEREAKMESYRQAAETAIAALPGKDKITVSLDDEGKLVIDESAVVEAVG